MLSQEEINERTNIINEIFELINHYPILDTKDRNGLTDYIDYIELSEVNDMVVRGKDKFYRPFFTIKFKVDELEPAIQTFFQRYSNDSNCWMGCGNFTHNLIDTSGGTNIIQFRFLRDLIKNKTATITKEISPCSEYFIGKKVTLIA